MKETSLFAKKNKILFLMIIMTLAVSLVLGGCNNGTPSTSSEPEQDTPQQNTPGESSTDANPENSKVRSTQLVKEFEALVQRTGNLPQAFQFINEHINELTSEDTSHILFALEDVQIKELAGFVNRYFEGNIQEQLTSIYKIDDSLNDLIDKADDESLKSLLTETQDSGYLLSIAEGMFAPVIDYSKVSHNLEKATDEIKAYFELRETESQKHSLSDAALVISWEELLNRGLAAERFTTKYPNAVRIKEVISLRDNYIAVIFYGANNTPLFDYDTKIMDSDARKAYETVLSTNTGNADSTLMQDLEAFMSTAAKENYKLTEVLKKQQSKFVPSVEESSS
ncbi:hypothetical protein D3C73_709520 [compost metagenome]